jgi:hypothetical protein
MRLDLVVLWHGQCGQLSIVKQIHDLYQHGTRKKLLGKIIIVENNQLPI